MFIQTFSIVKVEPTTYGSSTLYRLFFNYYHLTKNGKLKLKRIDKVYDSPVWLMKTVIYILFENKTFLGVGRILYYTLIIEELQNLLKDTNTGRLVDIQIKTGSFLYPSFLEVEFILNGFPYAHLASTSVQAKEVQALQKIQNVLVLKGILEKEE
jgi:hypothetical protein